MHSGPGDRPGTLRFRRGPPGATGPNLFQINSLPRHGRPSTSLREGRRLSGAGRRRASQPYARRHAHEDRPLLPEWSRPPARLLPRRRPRRRSRSERAAFLAARGVVRARRHRGRALSADSTRGFLEGGSASQDMLTAMMDAAQGGQVPAGGPLAVLGAAARAHRRPGQVHLHRAQLQGPRGRDEQPGAQAAAGLPQVGQRDPAIRASRSCGPAARRRSTGRSSSAW